MKLLVKPAIVLGIAGALALGSMTASQARVRPWVAGAAGFAAGAAIGAAAANSGYYGDGYYDGGYYNNAYYNSGYYGDSYAAAPGFGPTDPAFADTSDPNSVHGYGYNSYAYSPGYGYGSPGYGYGGGYGYDASTQSAPAHRDPGYGYNSNTIAPWQDRKLQGKDY
jgi:hypothetical protein